MVFACVFMRILVVILTENAKHTAGPTVHRPKLYQLYSRRNTRIWFMTIINIPRHCLSASVVLWLRGRTPKTLKSLGPPKSKSPHTYLHRY